MILPEGYSEAEVVEIVQRVSAKLASKFRFGYHEKTDIQQQAFLEVLKPDQNGVTVLEKFDPEKGSSLESFLWVYCHNRLFNFKRNNYGRPDKPCLSCPLNAYVNETCTAYTNEMDCDIYAKWFNRNKTKRNLLSTKESYDVEMDSKNIVDDIHAKELFHLVDSSLPTLFRKDWVKFVNGNKLSKKKKEALLSEIFNILEDNDIEP